MATYDLAYPGAAIDAILNTAYYLQEAGYIFRGSASDYSGTPSKREWVIAPAGFTGLGLSSAVPKGSIGVCLYNGTAWVGKVINVLTLDSEPTRNSQNGVTSGGVAATLDEIAGGIMETFASLLFDDETAAGDLSTKLSYAVKFAVSNVYQTVTHLNILAATTSKAGLMSAEDKAKVDSFLTNLRSLTFTDTTASADQGTKITETLKATIGGVQEVIDSITLLAATSSKAGLLSASDKAYIDALPATLTNLSNSISGALALMQSMMGYYVCDTAAGTAAKTVAATGYSLTNGGCIRIKMTNANTAANATLNINSTGAKALYYDGVQASSSNSWDAGDILEVFYDGTQYQCASGGGGKFATGEKVKETRIISGADGYVEGYVNIPNADILYKDIYTLTSSDFEQGSLDTDGSDISSTNRIRTKDYIPVNIGTAIDVALNGQSFIILYYNENKVVTSSTQWSQTDAVITINSAGYVRFLIRNTNDSNLTPSGLLAQIKFSDEGGLAAKIEEMYGMTDDLVLAPFTTRTIDISSITRSSLGYNQSTGEITSMGSGYYAKYIPVTVGCIYKISPAGDGYRVSMASFKTLPTAAKQTADIGNECMSMYGSNNPVGDFGESLKLKITESSYIYVRVDTARGSLSRAGGAEEYTYNDTIDDTNSIEMILQKKNGMQVLPITKAHAVKYGDTNLNQVVGTIESLVGTKGNKTPQTQSASFEQGAIDNGNDVSSNECMRTPASDPITVDGKGMLRCVFTVPKPKSSSPWSKPYFYKDGFLVDATYSGFQVNNGTIWEYYCDGSFNEIRWRVYVSSVASADISASSIACSFIEEGSGILGDIDKLQSNENSTVELYLGNLVQSSSGGYGALFDGNENFVCMKDALQVPYNGMTIKAKLPNNIKAAIRLGETGNNDLSTRIWLGNMLIYSVPANYNYYQIAFGIVNASGTPISPLVLADVEEYISNGEIEITYQVGGEPNILRSRPEAEIRSRAFKTKDNLPTFCHTSDQHGNVCGLMDAYRFAEYIGADAVVNTGDVCSYMHSNGYDFAKSLAEKYGTLPTLVAVGNHEAYNVSGEADIRSEFIDKFVTADYHISAGKTYYYYDFPSKSIRFIVLNSSQTGYSTYNNSGCMMQDQIDFLVSTLMSVPSGYGVVIGVHYPLVKKNLMIPNDYGFMNDWPPSQYEKTLPFATSLFAIIDAYIGRTTFSIAYTNDGSMNEGSGTTVSKTGDFSSANGEFICWMTGHTHQDRVAFFADTTYKQLCLNITCTASCDFQTTTDNIPRKGDGVCRNAFNIYTINRTEKNVYITRVGSDFTSDGTDRKFAIIRYADDA